MKPAERRARLGELANEAERRGWRGLLRWCIVQIARLVLREAAR